MTLLTAFTCLLARYSGQDDISVGVPFANRTHKQTEPLIGFFVNNMVLRIDLSGNPGFNELLQRVRKLTLEAHQNQDVPFEQLVEELQPERDLAYTPLFQSMFVLQNTGLTSSEDEEDAAEPVIPNSKIAKYDYTLFLEETGRGLEGVLEYNTDLFKTSTIQRHITHLGRIMESIAANPEQPVSDLEILTEAERLKILQNFNDNSIDYPGSDCIHTLFENQAARTPDAVALELEDRQLSYRTLENRASRLTWHIVEKGVKKGTMVAICLERSVDMIVSILSVLKSGGIFIPIDLSYSKTRAPFILEQTAPFMVLTDKGGREKLPEYSGEVLFPAEITEPAADDAVSDTSGNPEITADLPTYVVYTSGSTGRPKGIMAHHSAVTNYLKYIHNTYNVGVGDICVQLVSIGFDAALREIFGTLTGGARLALLPEKSGMTLDGVTELLIHRNVTRLLSVVPTYLRTLCKHILAGEFEVTSVNTILVSGEALFRSDYLLAMKSFGENIRMVNQYGPTETTMTAGYFPLDKSRMDRENILIGKPIPNVHFYILDSHGNPVPIGVYGEIHIGGAGVSKGYFGNSELTASQFIGLKPQISQISQIFEGGLETDGNPPEAYTVYRTGDIARYLEDGNIEFKGRIDTQVKIHGVRIELGEIETLLSQVPGVKESAVIVRVESDTDKQLVGCYVPADGETEKLSPAVVHGHMAEKLPESMIPHAFMVLEEMPLTPNGKIDRQALSEMSPDDDPDAGQTGTGPRSQVEELLVMIWKELLGDKEFGVHDNFFDLGGHSLMMLRMIARIRATFSVLLTLQKIFDFPTVAGVAEQLANARREEPLPKIKPVNRDEPGLKFPLSFAQQRLWFITQLKESSSAYNLPAALRLDGPLDSDALARSLKEIVRRHESLRMCFPSVEGEPMIEILENNFRLNVYRPSTGITGTAGSRSSAAP